MSKARIYGKQSSYIPNNQADMRFRRKAFEKRKYMADTSADRAYDRKLRRDEKKCGG